jgi:hypothetical protein
VFFLPKSTLCYRTGISQQHKPPIRFECSRTGTSMLPTSTHSCANNKEAGGFELPCGHDPPRPDPKDHRRGRKAKAPNTVPWKSRITPTRCTASFTSFALGIDSGPSAGYPGSRPCSPLRVSLRRRSSPTSSEESRSAYTTQGFRRRSISTRRKTALKHWRRNGNISLRWE